MDKSPLDADAGKTIKKLPLPDGSRVGILNLDGILQEVADLQLTQKPSIQMELLKRVQACNYVASGAENEYANALFKEYQRKWGKSEAGKDQGIREIHQHTKG